MASIDLRLWQSPGSSDLVFGDDAPPPSAADAVLAATLPALTLSAIVAPTINGTVFATFPALTLSAIASQTLTGTISATFPALSFAGAVQYQSHCSRPVVGMRATDWQVAHATESGARAMHQSTARTPTPTRAAWQDGYCRIEGVEASSSGRLVRARISHRTGYQDARRASPGGLASGFQDSSRVHVWRGSRFQDGDPRRMRRSSTFQDGYRDRRRTVASSYQKAGRLPSPWLVERVQAGRDARSEWQLGWQSGKRPPPGKHPSGPPVIAPGDPCYLPSPQLLFSVLAATDWSLLFRCERGGIKPPAVVPVRRVYVVLNNVTLHRVSDGAEVPAFSLSLALDAASWTWGFEALLPASAQALVDPGKGSGPVALVASVNGREFRVLAESIRRERSFGAASIRIEGRGRNAVLAAPYAPVMTFANAEARTARQLLDDVLTLNGIPLGWTIDWGLTDWNVPAGVFSHQGTWIEALAAIAGAAGGYLMPHPTAPTLRVRHRYPVAPWEWDTVSPDFVLPDVAVARESLRWREKPAYNRVFVSGQEVGVLGQVTRAGTAGDVLAPMVVDPLITAAAAARQRGLAVLADTGRQIEVTLRLPVLAETGIIEPGAFVEYQDGSVARLGLVRSTSIEAGFPEVWQTLGVEARV